MTDPLAEGYLPCPLVEGQDLSQPFAAAGEGMNCSIQQDSILGSFLLGKVLVNLITVDCFILVGQPKLLGTYSSFGRNLLSSYTYFLSPLVISRSFSFP